MKISFISLTMIGQNKFFFNENTKNLKQCSVTRNVEIDINEFRILWQKVNFFLCVCVFQKPAMSKYLA